MRAVHQKRRSAWVLFTFSAVVLIRFALPEGTSVGQEIRVIRVGSPPSTGDEIRIEPGFMVIDPGTIVIWWNKGKEEIKVIFPEGAKCDVGTGSPRGFHIESEAQHCYIAASIPIGETSSLRFISENIYEYEVRTGSKGIGKGKIVVAKEETYL